MPKLRKLNPDSDDGIYFFQCPGGHDHCMFTKFPNGNGAQWSFNGDLDKPTFSPSVLWSVKRPDGTKEMVCHSFVKDGMIQFLNDCTHQHAGKTLEIPDFLE